MRIVRYLIVALLCVAGAACTSSPSGPYNRDIQPSVMPCTPIYPGGSAVGTIQGAATDCQ